MSQAHSLPSQTAVLIVGGGPVGLTASALLSQQGIENVVVEKRTETQRAPAAHVLRPRPMEVFANLGVAEEIERAKPKLALDYITWSTALGGRDVGRIDLREGVPAGEEVWTNCPQNVLEPILLDHARSDAAATVVLGAECTQVEQNEAHVDAIVRLAEGTEKRIRARWLIAADGAGSPVRRLLGIPMIGPGPQGSFFMIHFAADLRPYIKDREGPLYFITNPAAPGSFIVHDPAKSSVYMTFRTGAENEEETLEERLKTALGVPASPRVLSIDAWAPHVQIAEHYRQGRAFLAGDAAHRFPPTGGLGLNTGILDVDFLSYQLSRVENEGASPSVLDTYQVECRPVAQKNATDSFDNMKRMAEISAVLGPFGDVATLEARLDSLSATEEQQLAQAVENQRSHFTSNGALPRDPRDLT